MGKNNIKVSSLKFLKRKSRVSILTSSEAGDRKSSTSSLGELQMALFFPDQQDRVKVMPIPTPPPSPPKAKLNEASKLTESTSNCESSTKVESPAEVGGSSSSPFSSLEVQIMSPQTPSGPGDVSTLDRGVRLLACSTEQDIMAELQSPPPSATSNSSSATSKWKMQASLQIANTMEIPNAEPS